jgi:competence protein ComGC
VRLGFKAFELLWVTNERLIVEVLLILALPNLADTDLVVKGVWKELR